MPSLFAFHASDSRANHGDKRSVTANLGVAVHVVDLVLDVVGVRDLDSNNSTGRVLEALRPVRFARYAFDVGTRNFRVDNVLSY